MIERLGQPALTVAAVLAIYSLLAFPPALAGSTPTAAPTDGGTKAGTFKGTIGGVEVTCDDSTKTSPQCQALQKKIDAGIAADAKPTADLAETDIKALLKPAYDSIFDGGKMKASVANQGALVDKCVDDLKLPVKHPTDPSTKQVRLDLFTVAKAGGKNYSPEQIKQACTTEYRKMSGSIEEMSNEGTKSVHRPGAGDECSEAIATAVANGACDGMSLQDCRQKYGCNIDKSKLRTWETTAQITNLGVQTISQTMSGVAQQKVAISAQNAKSGNGDPADVQKDALKSMADLQDGTAATQTAGTAVLALAMAEDISVHNRQSDAASELNGLSDLAEKHNQAVKDYIANPTDLNRQALDQDCAAMQSLSASQQATLAAASKKVDTKFDEDHADAKTKFKGIKDENHDGTINQADLDKTKEKGHNDAEKEASGGMAMVGKDAGTCLYTINTDKLALAIGKKNELAEKASANALQHGMQAAVMAAGAATNYIGAQMLRDEANQLGNSDVSSNSGIALPNQTLVAGAPTGTVADASPPPVSNPQLLGDNAAAATAADASGASAAPAGSIPPPLFGGQGGPGGLKDSGPGATGGMNGIGTTAGGGGGGGGGLGGGGDSGSGSGDGNTGGGAAVGSNAQFAAAGQGGTGFGAAAGPGAKRSDSTGMDINGLLSQFLPKKGEEAKNGGDITNSGNRGPASGQDASDQDSGILGPNSKSLFLRVSSTTVTYFKAGNLR